MQPRTALTLASFVTIGLLVGLLATLSTAEADPYFNSSEPGCNPASPNPNYLMCDDFEDGNWYVNFTPFTDPLNDGWSGWPFCPTCPTITPSGAILCGPGVTPFGNCAANGGNHTESGGVNMGQHHFKTSTCGTTGAELCAAGLDLYARWYAKWLSPYLFGAEKSFNITNSDSDIAFLNIQLNCGAGGQSSVATPSIQILHGTNICQAPNVSSITLQVNRWYFFELHLRRSTTIGAPDGLVELWINDCGAAGTTCGPTPILRTLMQNVVFNGSASNGFQIETIWMENWANPASSGTGPLWDQLIVSKVGPIGFMAVSGTPPDSPSNLTVR